MDGSTLLMHAGHANYTGYARQPRACRTTTAPDPAKLPEPAQSRRGVDTMHIRYSSHGPQCPKARRQRSAAIHHAQSHRSHRVQPTPDCHQGGIARRRPAALIPSPILQSSAQQKYSVTRPMQRQRQKQARSIPHKYPKRGRAQTHCAGTHGHTPPTGHKAELIDT